MGTYLPKLDASLPIIIVTAVAISLGVCAYVFYHMVKLLIPVFLLCLGVGITLQLLTIPNTILKYLPPGSQQQFLYAGAAVGLVGFLLLVMEYRK